ncbi:MAG: hydroxyacylglutathione hydrolase [Pseudomonadota bacterium]
MSLKIHQFPCLNDNYGFLIHDPESGQTLALDTPDGGVYLSEAEKLGWHITVIWNTHWHPDHTGGNIEIKQATGCEIIGPVGEKDKIAGIDRTVAGGDKLQFGKWQADVIDTPGHTIGHIAFYFAGQSMAFVGDSVFALGCGRIFEGDHAMMWNSMKAVRALPSDTTLYCAHEYTQSNAKFALTIEQDNAALKAYADEVNDKRSRGEPTVPMGLARELETNPFLRADLPELQSAMGHPGDDVATFAEIRTRKDTF